MAQIWILTKLELRSLYGLNALRFSKDKKAKRKSLGLLAVWFLLLAMLVFYVGSLSYGLIYLGLEAAVPAYLIMISSLLIFVFGMLKAGSVIFRTSGYDILCTLPIPKGAIAFSRLLRMYVEALVMAFAVLLPGIAVYIWNIRPGAGFYLTAFLGIWSVPLIPISAAILAGALVTGISSRMRHKSLAAAGLSIFAALGILFAQSRLSAVEDEMDAEMLKDLSASVMDLLGKLYPPAVGFGSSITHGSLPQCLLNVSISAAVSIAVAAGVALCFQQICQSLCTNFAKHNYEMGRLRANPVLASLCKREFKRYFSSSIYVANTMIGPVMGCVLSVALLVNGMETFTMLLPFPIDIGSMVPCVLAGAFCMMPASAASVSMEGKHWWIYKSLPLSAKNILDAKILMNLLLILPFYLLSELLLILALKPGAGELLWLAANPAAIILFSSVYGITVNLHFPVLEWENEVRVVKQSASALLGGLGGPILAILCAGSAGLVPREYAVFVKSGLCIAILLATAILYRKNNRYDIYGKI